MCLQFAGIDFSYIYNNFFFTLRKCISINYIFYFLQMDGLNPPISCASLAAVIGNMNNIGILTDVLHTLTIEDLTGIYNLMSCVKEAYDNEENLIVKNNQSAKINIVNYKTFKSLNKLKSLFEKRRVRIDPEFNNCMNMFQRFQEEEDINQNDLFQCNRTLSDLEIHSRTIALAPFYIKSELYRYCLQTTNKAVLSARFKISIRQIENYLKYNAFVTQYPLTVLLDMSFTFIVRNLTQIKSTIELDENTEYICSQEVSTLNEQFRLTKPR